MKTYVTRGELLALMNSEMSANPDCVDCEISGPVYALKTPQRDGTNWSDTLIISGHGRDPTPCFPSAVRIARAALAKYALRNDGGWLDDIVFSAEGRHFLAVSDQLDDDEIPYWYVSVDSTPEQRAFPASVEDTEPEALRQLILDWWKHGTLPARTNPSVFNQAPAHSQIRMVERFIYRSFQIDTNRINSRGRLESMNRLERWHENGVIHLDMSQVAHTEARTGSDSLRSSKALSYIYSMTHASTTEEQNQLRQIEAMLLPSGARTQNERNDVEIVFNALKYSRILVTADGGSNTQPGGLLGNRDKLAQLGVTIMRDSEAVHYIEAEIRRRDALAQEIAKLTGMQLPNWVGND